MSRTTPDLTGQTFTRLTVLHRVHFPGERDAFWRCRCQCGRELSVTSQSLRSTNTKSCGCLKRDQSRKNFVTHGYARGGRKTQEYHAWIRMKARCENPKHRSYKDYGARGITVCDRWRHSFPAFLADVGLRPGPGYSLGRIDNNGPYSPENCRWETALQQARNTRGCRPLLYQGERRVLTSWADVFRVGDSMLRHRLRKGWSLHDALTIPPNLTRHTSLTLNGETQTLQQWARRTGFHAITIHARLNKGWTVERALTQPIRRKQQG